MVHYICPKCAEPMNSDDTLVGEITECPRCGLPITVPGPGQPAGPAVVLRVGVLTLLRAVAWLTGLLGVALLLLCLARPQWRFVAAGVGLLLLSLLWLVLEAGVRELRNIRSELAVLNASVPAEPPDDRRGSSPAEES